MTNGNAPPFNLISEPWLPVLLADGSAGEWGLAEVFAWAHEARGLSESSPLTYTAVLRTLLAILHRATNGPRTPYDWAEMYRAGRFDADRIAAYLARWNDRFDLYHPERPFAQVDQSVAMKDKSPVTRLLMERSSGNNPTLFDHAYDAAPPALSPAQAARAVLTAHAYAFAGSGGQFKQSPMVAGYAITFEGRNLFETLLLNLYGYDDRYLIRLQLREKGDAPWWEWEEDPPVTKEGLKPRGLTDLLTWRSRQLRLLPEPDGHVRWVQYAQGYALSDPDLTLRDPFKRYVQADSGPSKGAYFPKNFSPGRALWRDVDALIEHAGSSTSPDDPNQIPAIVDWVAQAIRMLARAQQSVHPSIIATGLVNNQARIDLWRMERLPLPVTLLQDRERQVQIKRAIGNANELHSVLSSAGDAYAKMRMTQGVRKPDTADINRERAALKLDERYWSQLEPHFQRFLIALAGGGDPSQSLKSWQRSIEQIARDVFASATLLDPSQFRAWVAGDSKLRERLAQIDWTTKAHETRKRRKATSTEATQERAHANQR